MLDDLFKGQEEKIAEQVEEHFNAGMKHLEEKFYNQAMIEFKKAMELNQEEVYPRLMAELESATSGGNLEAALSIGLNLLKEDNTNFNLANKLGNYARELGNYTQAEGLYKMALKANRQYEKAFLNLAACMARVDIYDDAVKSAIGIFDEYYDYVYPDYMGEENFIANLEAELMTKVEEDRALEIQNLVIKKEAQDEAAATVEASETEFEIKKLKAKKLEVDPDDVKTELERLCEDDRANRLEHLFNLALYCLQNKDPAMAEDALAEIPEDKIETVKLLKILAVAKRDKLEEAAGMMIKLLGENEFNRYNNVNVGLMYKRLGKHFISTKYLIKTASLLDKSSGIYSMKELVKLANQAFVEGQNKKAMNFFRIAVSEIPSVDIYEKMGLLFIEAKKYDEAVDVLRKALVMDKDTVGAQESLRKIHDYYDSKGDTLLSDRKFKGSVEYFRKAINVLRLPETLKKTSGVYKELNDLETADELLDEYRAIMDERKKAAEEIERQKKLVDAVEAFKAKQIRKGLTLYEEAFRMKLDKDVFLKLAGLYKKLNKNNELAELVDRYNRMVEHEEKMRKYEKDKERAKASKSWKKLNLSFHQKTSLPSIMA